MTPTFKYLTNLGIVFHQVCYSVRGKKVGYCLNLLPQNFWWISCTEWLCPLHQNQQHFLYGNVVPTSGISYWCVKQISFFKSVCSIFSYLLLRLEGAQACSVYPKSCQSEDIFIFPFVPPPAIQICAPAFRSQFLTSLCMILFLCPNVCEAFDFMIQVETQNNFCIGYCLAPISFHYV